MKKTIFYTISAALLAAVSCDKGGVSYDYGSESSMKGIYCLSAPENTEIFELMPGKDRVIPIQVIADGSNVSDLALTATIKADPSLVEAFNIANGTDYSYFPAEAFEIVSNSVIIPRYGKTSSSAKVKITCSGLEEDAVYVLPVTIDKITGSDNIGTTATPAVYILMKKAFTGPEGGDGSAEYPYLLKTAEDLQRMEDKMVAGQKTYFKLENDVDLNGIDWVPINFASPFDLLVDFNGNGHKITNLSSSNYRYSGFFGVLYGECYDLTIENATIVGTSACGILAGYLGTVDLPGSARNVHVSGSVTANFSKNGVGGLAGIATDSVIEGCSADAEVTHNRNYVGGLIGYDNGRTVIRNCWTSGKVTGAQRCGGIIGGLIKSGSAIYNCFSTSEVEANLCVGGIVAHACLDKWQATEYNDGFKPDNIVEKCVAWNVKVTAKTATGDQGSSGAVIGYTNIYNALTDCKRKADFNLSAWEGNILFDQENSTSTSALGGSGLASATYMYPYHGKAAAPGATISSIARDLGWSEEIWDLSEDIPKLRK